MINPSVFLITSVFGVGSTIASEIILSEFVAHENSEVVDDVGNHSDWIEVVNRGQESVSLNGYYLTDNREILRRWQFPDVKLESGEHRLIFASGRDRTSQDLSFIHTNFRLDQDGEYLALVEPDGETILSEVSFPAQFADWSFSWSDESGEWQFSVPTPGVANRSGVRTPIGDQIDFSLRARTFDEAFKVDRIGVRDMEVRYSMSGDLPSLASARWKQDEPVTIDESCVLRTSAWVNDSLGAPVSSEIYLKIDPSLREFSSDLPIFIIDNLSQGKPRDETPGVILVYEPDEASGRSSPWGEADEAFRCGMKVRGSSSRANPKYPLRIELWNEFDRGESHSLIGLPSEEDWALQAPYRTDPSLIRNALAYDLSRQMGRYAPRTRFVEVFLNTDGGAIGPEDYFGLYVLTELIKQDDQRVNLNSSAAGNDGSITGYIFKQDRQAPGEQGFEASQIGRLTWVYPKERHLTGEFLNGPDPRIEYLIGYLDAFGEALLRRDDPGYTQHYSDFIDVGSWVDELILQTLTKNVEAFQKSSYLFKPEGGKLHRGPIWDFDFSMKFDATRWTVTFWQFPWWKELTWMPGRPRPGLGDADFMQAWVDRWQALRSSVLSSDNLNDTTERLAQEVAEAQKRNFARWKTVFSGTSYSRGLDGWEGEISHLKGWLEARAKWIDEQFVAQPLVVREGDRLRVTTESEDTELYYTSDGSDPRQSGGLVSPSATLAKSREMILEVKDSDDFRFRVRKGIEWSSLLPVESE